MTEENKDPQSEEKPEDCGGSCSGCNVEGCGSRSAEPPAKLEPNKNSKIAKTIAVVSGKGGVGKSFVTSLIAAELTRASERERRRYQPDSHGFGRNHHVGKPHASG